MMSAFTDYLLGLVVPVLLLLPPLLHFRTRGVDRICHPRTVKDFWMAKCVVLAALAALVIELSIFTTQMTYGMIDRAQQRYIRFNAQDIHVSSKKNGGLDFEGTPQEGPDQSQPVLTQQIDAYLNKGQSNDQSSALGEAYPKLVPYEIRLGHFVKHKWVEDPILLNAASATDGTISLKAYPAIICSTILQPVRTGVTLLCGTQLMVTSGP